MCSSAAEQSKMPNSKQTKLGITKAREQMVKRTTKKEEKKTIPKEEDKKEDTKEALFASDSKLAKDNTGAVNPASVRFHKSPSY